MRYLSFLLLLLSAGCGLAPGEGDHVTLTFRFIGPTPTPTAQRLLSEMTDFEPSAIEIDPQQFAMNMMTPPSSIPDFDCLGVNIVGPGIPPVNGNAPEGDLLAPLREGGACSYPGITSAPILRPITAGQTRSVQLSVPSGPERFIQIAGIVSNNTSICDPGETPIGLRGSCPPGVACAPSALREEIYEIGRTVGNLYSSQTLQVDNNGYNTMDLETRLGKRMNCGGEFKADWFEYKVGTAGATYVQCSANKVALFGGTNCSSGQIEKSCTSDDGSTCYSGAGANWIGACSITLNRVWAVCIPTPGVNFPVTYPTFNAGVAQCALATHKSIAASIKCASGGQLAASCMWDGTACATAPQRSWKGSCQTSIDPTSRAICAPQAGPGLSADDFVYVSDTYTAAAAEVVSPKCPAGHRVLWGTIDCGSSNSATKSCPSQNGTCISTVAGWAREWSFACSAAVGSPKTYSLVCVRQ